MLICWRFTKRKQHRIRYRRLRLQDTMELFRSRSSMADEEAAFSEEIKDSTILRRKGAILMVYLASLIGVENLESIFAEFLETWSASI